MLSLRFPIPIENTLTPLKPSSSGSNNSRSQSHRFSSLCHPKLRTTFPIPANVAVKEQAQTARQLNDCITPSSEENQLPAGLRPELIPKHVAIIMDGNARWARQRGLPASAGHEAGVRSLRGLTELCCSWGIKVLTVFAFSYDNWLRPKVEVDFLMSLFERVISSEMENFAREGIQISVIGDSSKFPKSLQTLISKAEEMTKDNSRLQLIVAVSYSGKYDVVQACRSIVQKVKDDLIQLEDINDNLIEQELETNCTEFPYPDLLIRTSGELRVSNFFLWQLAYTELFFVQKLWPDFGKAEFVEALTSFQQRQRRYGGRDS
ncbi:Alkyl transferase [Quillaja saponaria]|uniref:Alkyl transferase n=1 Tax=Quillaja saponaria TaxID=32244 RepID=A0AAD7PLR3_QUISA|nr:Alkyl transferase [Quillaja saponaria]